MEMVIGRLSWMMETALLSSMTKMLAPAVVSWEVLLAHDIHDTSDCHVRASHSARKAAIFDVESVDLSWLMP